MTLKPSERIFAALDTPDLDIAIGLARSLKSLAGGMKLGKEFFTALGPEGVARVAAEGMPIFLDLKFHDIPNTVAGAVRAAVNMKPHMLNVHATGGEAMMKAAAAAAQDEAEKLNVSRPLVLGVTVLTSLDDGDLKAIGVNSSSSDQVARLAALAQKSGLDGVVCSGSDLKTLRRECGADFKLLTPGIRPAWAAANDQKRILTPSDAVARGADYLVIGRPITGAEDPAKAAALIAEELDQAAQ